EREHEIYLEYPEYYEDEGILEEEKWLEEFLNQLPEKKREYFEKLIKES
ncbi:MAG: stathmin-1-A, partial [Clostridia bacterium]